MNPEENLIFGYTWDEIQRAQQGGPLVRNKQLGNINWTQEDERLWQEYGSVQALVDAGLHGVADRASRLGKEKK